MNFKDAANVAREISRDWGIIAVNFQHTSEGKMEAKECAAKWLDYAKRINDRCALLQEALHGKPNIAGQIPRASSGKSAPAGSALPMIGEDHK